MMDGCMMNGCMHNGWMDGRMNAQMMDESMDACMDGWTVESNHLLKDVIYRTNLTFLVMSFSLILLRLTSFTAQMKPERSSLHLAPCFFVFFFSLHKRPCAPQ